MPELSRQKSAAACQRCGTQTTVSEVGDANTQRSLTNSAREDGGRISVSLLTSAKNSVRPLRFSFSPAWGLTAEEMREAFRRVRREIQIRNTAQEKRRLR